MLIGLPKPRLHKDPEGGFRISFSIGEGRSPCRFVIFTRINFHSLVPLLLWWNPVCTIRICSCVPNSGFLQKLTSLFIECVVGVRAAVNQVFTKFERFCLFFFLELCSLLYCSWSIEKIILYKSLKLIWYYLFLCVQSVYMLQRWRVFYGINFYNLLKNRVKIILMLIVFTDPLDLEISGCACDRRCTI